MTISLAQFQVYLLAFTRIMTILAQVPMLGGKLIPRQVKIGLGLLLTFIMVPIVMPKQFPLPPETPAMSVVPLAVAMARELLIGMVAGYAASLTFGILTMTGEFMSTSGGFSAGRTFNPTFGASGASFDQLFLMTAMLLFLVINGHHLVLIAVQQTFVAAPLNGDFAQLALVAGGQPLQGAERLMTLTLQLIVSGTLLALPVMGVSLLADLTLGLLARVAPQVQVFFLGMPLKVGLSLTVLAIVIEIMTPALRDLFHAIGPRMLFLLGA
jgi:flagellar biosynthesis protein FliR